MSLSTSLFHIFIIVIILMIVVIVVNVFSVWAETRRLSCSRCCLRGEPAPWAPP